MLRRLLLAALGLALAGGAEAAGTVTTVEVSTTSVRKVTFSWTSDAAGAADGATTKSFDGAILGLATIPAGGGTAPTDNYDLTLVDEAGHDVLLGAGANRDTANTEYVPGTSLAGVAGSPLTLHITNAGNAKAGTVVVFIR